MSDVSSGWYHTTWHVASFSHTSEVPESHLNVTNYFLSKMCEACSKQRWNFPVALFEPRDEIWCALLLIASLEQSTLVGLLSFCTFKGQIDVWKSLKKKKKTPDIIILTVGHFASCASLISAAAARFWTMCHVEKETWIHSYYIDGECWGEPPFAGRPFFVLHSSARAISNNQYIYSAGIVIQSPVLSCYKDIMDYFFWDIKPFCNVKYRHFFFLSLCPSTKLKICKHSEQEALRAFLMRASSKSKAAVFNQEGFMEFWIKENAYGS